MPRVSNAPVYCLSGTGDHSIATIPSIPLSPRPIIPLVVDRDINDSLFGSNGNSRLWPRSQKGSSAAVLPIIFRSYLGAAFGSSERRAFN